MAPRVLGPSSSSSPSAHPSSVAASPNEPSQLGTLTSWSEPSRAKISTPSVATNNKREQTPPHHPTNQIPLSSAAPAPQQAGGPPPVRCRRRLGYGRPGDGDLLPQRQPRLQGLRPPVPLPTPRRYCTPTAPHSFLFLRTIYWLVFLSYWVYAWPTYPHRISLFSLQQLSIHYYHRHTSRLLVRIAHCLFNYTSRFHHLLFSPSCWQVNTVRQFYENLVPSYTICDIDCPDYSFRKFTDDGNYLVAFSRNHQDLIVYRPIWPTFSCNEPCDSHDLPPKAKKFDSFFKQLYSISLASSNEYICKDFFLYMECHQFGLFATSTAQSNDSSATEGAIHGVPSIEKITFYLVRYNHLVSLGTHF